MNEHIKKISQDFLEYLRKKNLLVTRQREVIVQTAFSTTEHYTAARLLELAKEVDPTVSRASVYRTLQLLVEAGLLKELDFGHEEKYYDPNYLQHPNHNHLICQDCNKIVEFENPEIDQLEDRISDGLGFTPSSKTLQIRASCQKLKQLGACESQTISIRKKTRTPQM